MKKDVSGMQGAGGGAGIASLKGIVANLKALKKEAKTTVSSEGDFADKVRLDKVGKL